MEKLYDFDDIPKKFAIGYYKILKLSKRKILFKKRKKQERRKNLIYLNKSLGKPNSFYSKFFKQSLNQILKN